MPENKKYRVIEANNPGSLAEKLNSAENDGYKLTSNIYNHGNTLVVILIRKE